MILVTKTSDVRVCACAVVLFILDVKSEDAPAGVTQKEGQTRFLRLPSTVASCLTFWSLLVVVFPNRQ